MRFYPKYIPTDAEIDALFEEQRALRLITVDATGVPRLGLYPYVRREGGFEVHLLHADELLEDLARKPTCLVEIDEVLGTIPSNWEHPEDASRGDVYYRSVQCTCAATVINDPAAVADHLTRVLARFQPGAPHRAVRVGEPLYDAKLRALRVVQVAIIETRAKFKLSQQVSAEDRVRVLEGLRARDTAADRKAVALIEARTPRTTE